MNIMGGKYIFLVCTGMSISVYTRLYRYIPDYQIITLILPLIMNISGAAEVGGWGARISPNQRRDLFRHGIGINIGDLRPGLGLSMTGSSSVTGNFIGSVTGNFIGR